MGVLILIQNDDAERMTRHIEAALAMGGVATCAFSKRSLPAMSFNPPNWKERYAVAEAEALKLSGDKSFALLLDLGLLEQMEVAIPLAIRLLKGGVRVIGWSMDGSSLFEKEMLHLVAANAINERQFMLHMGPMNLGTFAAEVAAFLG